MIAVETLQRFEYVVSSIWLLALFALYLDHRRRVMKVKRLDEPDLYSQCKFHGETYTITTIDMSYEHLTFGLVKVPSKHDNVL